MGRAFVLAAGQKRVLWRGTGRGLCAQNAPCALRLAPCGWPVAAGGALVCSYVFFFCIMFSALLHRHAAPRLWVAAVVLFSGAAWAQPAALNVLAGGAPGQEVKTRAEIGRASCRERV